MSSGNGKKAGRNKIFCKAYKERGTEAKNKARKAKRQDKIEAKHMSKKLKRGGRLV